MYNFENRTNYSKYEALFPQTGEIFGHETSFKILYKSALLNCRRFDEYCFIAINNTIIGKLTVKGFEKT